MTHERVVALGFRASLGSEPSGHRMPFGSWRWWAREGSNLSSAAYHAAALPLCYAPACELAWCQGQDLHLQHTGSGPASSAGWDTLASNVGSCGRIRTGTEHVLDVLPLPKVGVRSRASLRSWLRSSVRSRGDSNPTSRGRQPRSLTRCLRDQSCRACRRLDSNQQTLPSEGCARSTWRRRVAPGAGFEPAIWRLTGARVATSPP